VSPTAPSESDTGRERLSPLVRRLLRERRLHADAVPGTGADGRITPDDVRCPDPSSQPPSRRLSPLVKRLSREREVDAGGIDGTGRDGRVTPDDVRAAAAAGSSRRPAPDAGPSEDGGTARSWTEPLTRTRRTIARRMHQSLTTTAQLTSVVEADVTRIMGLRTEVRDAARARIGTSISPLAFIAHATARTLRSHPLLNASIDAEAGTCTFHDYVDLGIAVDTPNGLMVPVLRDAHASDPVDLASRIGEVAARARDRRVTPDDLAGGTFTITNTGSAGSLFDTPILDPPQVAVLATPQIERRPVVISDAYGDHVAIRERTYLCLTYDHRLVDGADAARFLNALSFALDTDQWGPEVEALRALPDRGAPTR
jgi:pyruvate dehydrogenase E2 component (dihydrolipoamide acetyltransferase)